MWSCHRSMGVWGEKKVAVSFVSEYVGNNADPHIKLYFLLIYHFI